MFHCWNIWTFYKLLLIYTYIYFMQKKLNFRKTVWKIGHKGKLMVQFGIEESFPRESDPPHMRTKFLFFLFFKNNFPNFLSLVVVL